MASPLTIFLLIFASSVSLVSLQDKEEPGNSESFEELLKKYDKNKRPGFGTVDADVCDFHIVLYKIGPVSETNMGVTTDVYVRQTWKDPRVSDAIRPLFESVDTRNGTQKFISLTKTTADNIWRPNIYFKDSISETTPDEVSQSQFLRVFENGEIRSSRRVLLTTRCALNLRFFPLDLQLCPICFESYELDDSEQLIRWGLDELNTSEQSTATFDVESKIVLTSNTVHYPDLGNNYTTLCLEIRMSRKVTMYIVTMYLPSVALVILSWVSFWIDKKAVPARAGLTITTILAQITLITGTANKFPGIADLKLGDTYMIVNFFFVFGSLIEFAMVSGQEQQKLRDQEKPPEKGSEDVTNEAHNGDELQVDKQQPEKENFLKRAKNEINRNFQGDVDLAARVLFPATFTIWNIVYFALGFGLRSHGH